MKASRSIKLHVVAALACSIQVLLVSGCASPGPPRAPSLQLPQPVRDLTATREGNSVELHFTLSLHTTDGAPLRPPIVAATLCRGLVAEPCAPVSGKRDRKLSIAQANGRPRTIAWRDALSPALTAGLPRPLLYRVQLGNSHGRTAGWSAAAYTVAGSAPPAVENLSAEATPQGILLRWRPIPSTSLASGSSPAEVLLRRVPIGASSSPPGKAKPSLQPVWLATHAETPGAPDAESLDTSAQPDVPYRYIALRREIVTVGDRRLEVRSQPSAPVEITLRDIFPPPVPTGLTAAGFSESGRFAIDLVWNPVADPHLAGYNILRQPLDANGTATAAPQLLNKTPVALPAFHDATANSAQRYRYNVSAIDQKGNQSAPVTVIVEPSSPE